jgi:hypothetical protein
MILMVYTSAFGERPDVGHNPTRAASKPVESRYHFGEFVELISRIPR